MASLVECLRQRNEGGQARRRVFIVRHGERADAVDPHWVSSPTDNPMDPPLTKVGQREAAERAGPLLAEALACRGSPTHGQDTEVEVVVVCSPFRRCVQTAVALLPSLHAPKGAEEQQQEEERRSYKVVQTVVDHAVGEWLRPCWYPENPLSALTTAEDLQHPGLGWSRFRMEESCVVPTFPEPFLVDFYSRVFRGTRSLVLEEFPTQDVVFVTHGAGCDAIAHALVEGLVPAYLYWAPYLGLTVLEETQEGGSFEIVYPTQEYVRELMPHERK